MGKAVIDKVITTSEVASGTLGELFRWADTVDIAYAWARSEAGTAKHWRNIDLRKLRNVVIGTQFAQTEPWLLSRLHEHASRYRECIFRVVIRTSSTFHPKIAIGRKGRKIRVLMGSSNLTKAGFGKNTEVNVLITLDADSTQAGVFDAFMGRCVREGVELDPVWLDQYLEDYKKKPPEKGWVNGEEWRLGAIDDLDIDWSSYVSAVRRQEGRPLSVGGVLSLFDSQESYFAEFERMAPVVAAKPTFRQWEEHEQMAAIGLGAASGYLGRMGRARRAINLIRTKPAMVGRFLDAIPRTGPVPTEVFLRTIHGLMGIKHVGIGVATRLLVATRPDLFLPVNDANQKEIARFFGKQVKKPQHYVQLMERIWATPWFRSPWPRKLADARIWDYRAAILDAIVYAR